MSAQLASRRARRVLIACLIGLTCGLASWLITTVLPPGLHQDFYVIWQGARAVARGMDPYAAVRGLHDAPIFFYPMPTAIAIVPFSIMSPTIAGSLVLGASCALLAFVVTEYAWWPLLVFLSGSALLMIAVAQLSAWMTAGIFLPSLTWLGVFKPNIGLAMLAYRPSWKQAAIMVAIGAASLVVRPTWPVEWIATARMSPFHFAPWRMPGGVLLFAALIRWRRPEARMLAMLALVPSSPIIYEALPLFVIPRTRLEMILLVVLSEIALLATLGLSLQNDPGAYLARAEPALVWLMYIPALVMVLRRPNVGDTPSLPQSSPRGCHRVSR